MKPDLNITKTDCATIVLARAVRAARKAGWSKDEIKDFVEEARNGDYNHMITTTQESFNIIPPLILPLKREE